MADESLSLGARLEAYTLRFPQEVLMVQVVAAGQQDQVLIFKGFSSSLVNPTAYDPDVPVLSADAEVQSLDRLRGPFRPDSPEYIERSISLDAFLERLSNLGL